MTLSTAEAKVAFAKCLADHRDELASLHGVPAALIADLKSWKRTKKEKRETEVSRVFAFRDNSLLVAYVHSDAADERFTSIAIGYWSGCNWRNLRKYYFPGGEDIEKEARRKEDERWAAERRQEAEATVAITSAPPSEVLNKLLHNPIKVKLHAEGEHTSDRLSGRIIFYPPADAYTGNPSKDMDAFDKACEDAATREYSGGESFGFECGPEDEGHLADSDYCDDGLKKLFADFGEKIDIGASENSHVVFAIPGIKASELWYIIQMRLVRSGAVKAKE